MRAVNLIPAEQRGGASVGAGRSGGAAYAILGVCGGLALMALLYGIAAHQVNSRQSEANSLAAKAQAAQAATARLGPYSQFIAMSQQRMAAVEALVNSRFDWAHTFHEFARVLPPDASISSMSGAVGTGSSNPGSTSTPSSPSSSSSSSSSTSSSSSSTSSSSGSGTSTSSTPPSGGTGSTGGAVTSATPAGSVPIFTVSGCATSQKVVAETINRIRLIDGVASVALQSSTATANSSAGAAASGTCAPKQPAYQLQVTFLALPGGGTVTAATATPVAQTGTGASR